MDINAFLKQIKDTLAQRVSPAVTNYIKQVDKTAQVIPSFVEKQYLPQTGLGKMLNMGHAAGQYARKEIPKEELINKTANDALLLMANVSSAPKTVSSRMTSDDVKATINVITEHDQIMKNPAEYIDKAPQNEQMIRDLADDYLGKNTKKLPIEEVKNALYDRVMYDTKMGAYSSRPDITKPLRKQADAYAKETKQMVQSGELPLDMSQVPKGAEISKDGLRFLGEYNGQKRWFDIPTKAPSTGGEIGKVSDTTKEWLADYFGNPYFTGKRISPPKEALTELKQFVPNKPIKLYRGIAKPSNSPLSKAMSTDAGVMNQEVSSWTRNRKVAQDFASGGKIEERLFKPDEILVDTTMMPKSLLRNELGNMTDEAEVIVKNIKLGEIGKEAGLLKKLKDAKLTQY